MREYTSRERGYIWLSLIDSLSIVKKYELLKLTHSVEELYLDFARYTDKIIALVGNTQFAHMTKMLDDAVIDEVIAKMDTLGVDIITIEDDDYPPMLRDIETPPLMLYYKGNRAMLSDENTLAVVGSRRATRYGKDVTRMLVRDVARAGITIVSGLARGIDTVAHRTTLEEGGRTIAVVANGLANCYPPENHELMEQIEAKGIVITEYPLDGVPYASRFPERNRIISGLAKGTLVTEAGRNSGSLITLNSALDQGRDVYIVPSNINSDAGYGSNEALKRLQGACVTESEDILCNYSLSKVETEEDDIELSDTEKKIVSFIKEEDRHIDEIAAMLNENNVNDLLATLAKLELLGVIQRLPGNYYGK